MVRMLTATLVLSGLLATASTADAGYVNEWTLPAGFTAQNEGFPDASDATGDGAPELLAANLSTPRVYRLYDGPTLLWEWTADPAAFNVNAPLFLDVDGDGVKEAWIREDLTGGNRFSVIDWQTATTETTFVSTPTFQWSEFVGAFDWDDDGELEMVLKGRAIPYPGYSTYQVWGFTGPVSVVQTDTGTSPFRLRQNHPNPFGSSTAIQFDLPDDAEITLQVYDVTGRLVRTLGDSVFKNAGRYSLAWDGQDNSGDAVSSGVYFYRLRAGEYTEARRMVLLR